MPAGRHTRVTSTFAPAASHRESSKITHDVPGNITSIKPDQCCSRCTGRSALKSASGKNPATPVELWPIDSRNVVWTHYWTRGFERSDVVRTLALALAAADHRCRPPPPAKPIATSRPAPPPPEQRSPASLPMTSAGRNRFGPLDYLRRAAGQFRRPQLSQK
jgi:hypothetical protein